MMTRPDREPEPFSSNAIRLSPGELIRAAAIVLMATVVGPEAWRALEPFAPDADYRIPYELSEDYWLFRRYSRFASARDHTLLIGDSVIWGQYVDRDETLAHHLNELTGTVRYSNLGVDGTHPMALAGLLRYYGRAIRDREVILHLNPLWLSSPQSDLQTRQEVHFNHPRLVPQFAPPIPGYTETVSGRLGIVLERRVRFLEWIRHLQSVCFDQMSLQQWTVENPYANPLRRISLQLPEADAHRDPGARPAPAPGRPRPSLPWVDLETSLQWRAFRRLIDVLEGRGNRLLVIVGPLDEHRLHPDNVTVYRDLLEGIGTALRERGVESLLLPLLPAEWYADLSHPIGPGYASLAEHIMRTIRAREDLP